jgi:flagellar FliL protein
MSAAAAAEAAPAPKSGGKKKLIIIIVAALVLLGAAGTGAVIVMKKRAAEAAAAAEDAGDDAGAGAGAGKHEAKAAAHDEHKTPPVFVPLDPFVINLADHDADRYAQIGITLQVLDAHVGDEITNYKPAIRNNILMLLAHKTSEDLAGREGKEQLAREVRIEALRAMGYHVADDEATAAEGASAPKKAKKKAAAKEEEMPITSVQFSSFIIQ